MPTVLEDVDEEAVPSVQPSRCRVSAQDHAEVTLEDRVPANLPPDSDLFAIPDRETASFKAASVDDGMDKHIHVYDVSKFDGSYGCESPRKKFLVLRQTRPLIISLTSHPSLCERAVAGA